ncbi:rhamnulokinase [Rhizobium leguminosarum]|uniref:rhamnulokinase n=1 Tax=Rhizobium leguminosarum TaxID=384 RepID=UPI003F9749AE
MINCLVVDLGAGSGRAMLGRFDGQKVDLSEVHRFSGIEMRLDDGPHWDLNRLLEEIKKGLQLALERCAKIDSIGVDSWGVDYALVDASGKLQAAPHHYRHPRSQRGYDAFPMTPGEMFERTGSQVLPINTVYQLFSAGKEDPSVIATSQRVLMIADAVNYYLTGAVGGDLTLARTSGLLSLDRKWDRSICSSAGIPLDLLPPLKQPGTVLGRLREELQLELQLHNRIPVISVAAHDTASAVCGLPLRTQEAFLICGSWSIIGREVRHAITSEDARLSGFGNEGGIEGRQLFLRSLNGLHLLQKLRTHWSGRVRQEISFAQMSDLATIASARGMTASINPSDPAFFDPPDIVAALTRACPELAGCTNDDLGALALAVYRGLIEDVADSLLALERQTNEPVARLRICGGGGRDALLCQLIANRTSRIVTVGPIEASAWGNIAMQLIGLGLIENLAAARIVIEKSADILNYYPQK